MHIRFFALAMAMFMSPASWGASPEASNWQKLLSESHLSCSKIKPCAISEGKDHTRFYIYFVTTDDRKTNLRSVEKIVFRNRENEDHQEFPLADVTRVGLDDPFEFYTFDLRQLNVADFALLSFDSLHSGPLYFYFIYNPSSHKFVVSKEAIPKVRFVKTKQTYEVVDFPEFSYRLSSDLHFVSNNPERPPASHVPPEN